MDTVRLMTATIAVRKAYRRFAQLSEEEKQQVVDKVKEKLKQKYPDADSGEPAGENSSPDGHVKVVVPVEGQPQGDAPQGDTPQGDVVVTPVEGDVPPPPEEDIINPDELDWGDDGGDESEDEETAPQDSSELPESPADGKESETAPEDVTASPEDEDVTDDDGDEADDVDDEISDIADDMAEDVEEIKTEQGIDSSRIVDLFDSMMKMVTLLVHSRLPETMADPGEKFTKVASRIAQEAIAERVARDVMSLRGLQLNRKDKDTMSDTGGSSKGRDPEPDFKPSRDDMRKPFRTKDKPAEERDPDTDLDPDKRKD